ncbi:MAG: TlpA disulfide reductase family protein [Pseudomonadota bacterium]
MNYRRMINLIGQLGLLISIFITHTSWAQPVQPYKTGEWNQVLSKYTKPFIVHVWGTTCAPCRAELSSWGKLIQQEKHIPIIFLQVDNAPKEIVSKMISNAHLSNAQHYSSESPFDEYFRYEIDAHWNGETPFTLFIDKQGKATSLVGPTNFDTVKAWLAKHH